MSTHVDEVTAGAEATRTGNDASRWPDGLSPV